MAHPMATARQLCLDSESCGLQATCDDDAADSSCRIWVPKLNMSLRARALEPQDAGRSTTDHVLLPVLSSKQALQPA